MSCSRIGLCFAAALIFVGVGICLSGSKALSSAPAVSAGHYVVSRTLAARSVVSPASNRSHITALSVSGSQPVGTFNSVPYVRTWGTLTGVVAPGEDVHGLSALPHNRDGNYEYTSEFEIVAPSNSGVNSAIVIEVENRGSPVLLNALDQAGVSGPPSTATYSSGMGNGFLPRHATSYARVQWQTGIAAGVPKGAQGVGEVIVRDFGRLLAGKTKLDTNSGFNPGVYRTRVLGGISQSGFFIVTFIAEGFNADPIDGSAVFNGAIAVDGTGNWLTLNQLAAANGAAEEAYLFPNGRPLSAEELLKRPASDPFYIDIANYTDFYRLRASVTDYGPFPARMRRYDWPSPHAAGPIARIGTGGRASRCNADGVEYLNPISYVSYLRAVTLELEHTLGVESAKDAPELPPSALFKLGRAPASTTNFNPLPAVELKVPLTDSEGQPIGGVRFPEVEHPVGRPSPVSLAPVSTASISQTCGNAGGWQPFAQSQLAERYADQSNYVKLYGDSLDKLIAAGYLLPEDRAQMLKTAAVLYSESAR